MRNLSSFLSIALFIFGGCTDGNKSNSSEPDTNLKSLASLTSDTVILFDTMKIVLNPSFKDFDLIGERKESPGFIGGRIPAGAAKARIKLYKMERQLWDPNYDPEEDAYGHTFPLNELYEFGREIRRINSTIPYGSDTIDGFRVYYGRQLVRSGGATAFRPEVFLIPTIGKRNYYDDVDDDLNAILEEINDVDVISKQNGGDDAILNSSIPCPNQCN